MKKFVSLATLAMLPVFGILFTTPVFADSPGQLSNAATNYEVKNVTTNGSYSQSINAVCNDTVKYSVLLSNSDYGMLNNVTVKTDLTTGKTTVSAKNAANATTSVSGSVNVSLPANATLNYIAGSTVRVAGNNSNRTAVADGITTNGVNVGELAGSTEIFVQFQAKINCAEAPKKIQVCELATKKLITIDEKDFDMTKHSKTLSDCAPKPPVPGEIVVCETATKKIVTIKENEFDASKHSKTLSDCNVTPVTPVTPTELPQTGAEGAFAFVAALLTAAAGYAVNSRKNLLG